MPVQKRLLTENWPRRFRGPYRRADSTDAFGDSWRGPYQPDTADGRTTSPKPPPFTLPRTLHQISSPDSPSQSPSCDQPQNPILDRSQSAPATLEQATTTWQCKGRPGLPELPRPSSPAEDAPPPLSVHTRPLPLHSSNPDVLPVPSPSTDVLRTRSPHPDMSTTSQDPGAEVQPDATEGESGSDEVEKSSMCTTLEELSPVQPMEQEATESGTVDAREACPMSPGQLNSVEMDSPSAPCSVVSSEKEQPDGDRPSSSDNIPSLAAALMELHELLLSNNCAQSQNRSTSCSPSNPLQQDSDKESPKSHTPTPESTRPTSITAGAETSDAKANYANDVSDEEPSQSVVPDFSGQDEHLGGGTADTAERPEPPQCPDGSEERGPDERRRAKTSNISVSQPEPEVPPDPVGDLEFREPPEGQHGRGFADGQASGSNTRDTLLSPLSVESPEEVSSSSSSSAPRLTQARRPSSPAPLLPSPHPFIEQFPAEHIQRIQAAGFSAREAVEALERAHGVVELALLALLARSITVPT
ncbi:protein DDI1 homolog 2 isoform X1 [Leuresthes tenuis]|uniref:protein DDI1 homolog 2 isoform X1 n=1 Tax=Leuresthes tenuis TaxID=355514 RepID=UPI003B507A0B